MSVDKFIQLQKVINITHAGRLCSIIYSLSNSKYARECILLSVYSIETSKIKVCGILRLQNCSYRT